MSKTLSEAAKSGSKIDTLTALRDSIAANIEKCDSGRDLAALSKRLMEIMNEIEELEKTSKPVSNPMTKRKAKRNA